ncbi:hypothetical protein CCAX7_14610 [Capsulimonas corticalis]|uniref:Uncharacterized protein n=1 Tax=Capsulimonas corticalis TaxID=2219043 RepID=A0A402CZH3_9BACT|nr:phage portal protein [Capsulimonas corticalis]BDI29410.1 hypothetical protein CCAX7_14610 [Capsulimonas corticalis]
MFFKAAGAIAGKISASFKAAGDFIKGRPVFSSAGRGRGGLWNWLPGSNYNYEREAGDLWKNSLVSIVLSWMQDNFPEAPFVVRKTVVSTGKSVADHGHPLSLLLAQPNPFYGGDVLWAATILDLATDGNAYWIKVPNAIGVAELWWIPASMIEPDYPSDGSEFITQYIYTVNGRKYYYKPSQIVHLRDGTDPDARGRKGLSRLKAQLREVCTDNEAATFNAAILRNMGIPGLIIAPQAATTPLTPEDRRKLVDNWSERFGGDKRGEPFVWNTPINVQGMGHSPRDLEVGLMRRIPETRIAAAFGLSPIVVNFLAGLEHGTMANYKEARKAAYENCLIPMYRRIALQLDVQLLPDFETDRRYRCGFDLSEVRALQDDVNALFERLENAAGGPFITPDEAREAAGYKATGDPENQKIRAPKPVAPALPKQPPLENAA